MGNIVTSTLPVFATMTLPMTVLPFTMAMWLYNDSVMSWAVATSLILVWQAGVSFGFGVSDPFKGLVGADYVDARTALGVLVILCMIYAVVGTFIGWLLQIEDILPYYALFTSNTRDVGAALHGKVSKALKKASDRKKKIEDVADTTDEDDEEGGEKPTGLSRGEMRNLRRPYAHCTWVTLFFAIGVALPNLLHAFIIDDTDSRNAIALSCDIILPVVSTIALLVYCLYTPDPLVWGLHKRNYKRVRGATKTQAEEATPATKERIFRTILAIGIPYILGNIALGCARVFGKTANFNLVAACIAVSLIFVISILTYIVLYKLKGKEPMTTPTVVTPSPVNNPPGNNDNGDDDEEVGAASNNAVANDQAVVVQAQYHGSGLHTRLQGVGFV